MSQLTAEQVGILLSQLDAREHFMAAVIDEHIAGLRACNSLETNPAAGDVADLAEVELVRNRQYSAVDHDLQVIREIDLARARIAAGSIGTCLDCGDAIGFERLLAQPTAARCVYCQGLYEQTHRQAAGAQPGFSIEPEQTP